MAMSWGPIAYGPSCKSARRRSRRLSYDGGLATREQLAVIMDPKPDGLLMLKIMPFVPPYVHPVPSSLAGVQDLERAHRRGPVVEDKRSADQYAVHARDGGLHAPLRFTPLGRVRGQLVSLLSHADFPRFYVESVLG